MTRTARDSDPSAERCASGEDSARDVVQVLAGGPDSTEPSLAQRLGVRLGPTSTFPTTEHFNLQTARSITVAEANGRASIYLAALSSNLIALAFIGQMSRLGAAFYAFALILLPGMVFVGVVTFLRLVQSFARGHRVRSPDRALTRPLPATLARARTLRPRRSGRPRRTAERAQPTPTAWQLTLTAAGMVAVVNSVVVAAVAGVALAAPACTRSPSRWGLERSSEPVR